MPGQGYQFIEMALRNKRDQAQLDYQMQRDRRRETMQALESMPAVAASISKTATNAKRDSIANSLMNEATPPRAEAADPRLAAAMSAQGLGSTRPATGGVGEMEMRMALENQQGRQSDREFSQGMAMIREQRMAQSLQQKQAALDQRAIQAAQATPQKVKDLTTAADAFFAQETALQNRMQNSGSQDEYQGYANQLRAAYIGAKSAGVKLPDEYSMPTWEDVGVIRQQERNVAEAQSVVDARGANAKDGPNWWPFGSTKGQELEAAKAELQKTPGYRPPTQPAAPQPRYQSSSDPREQARAAIAAGASPAAVKGRLRQVGIDPSFLD